jgi:hypothetical protein
VTNYDPVFDECSINTYKQKSLTANILDGFFYYICGSFMDGVDGKLLFHLAHRPPWHFLNIVTQITLSTRVCTYTHRVIHTHAHSYDTLQAVLS